MLVNLNRFKRLVVLFVSLFLVILLLSVGFNLLSPFVGIDSAIAVKPDPPPGGGPPDGAGPPDSPGGGKPGGTKGEIYADLVKVYRNEFGLPILTDTTYKCVQPVANFNVEVYDPSCTAALIDFPAFCDDTLDNISFPSIVVDNPDDINGSNDPDNQTRVSTIPLGGSGEEGEECDILVNYIDPLDPLLSYGTFVQETDMGRLSVIRSPKTLAKQLTDVIANIENATLIDYDHAGRLILDGVAVDSPLQNAALYYEMLRVGKIEEITLPGSFTPLDWAAAWLGTAADKGGQINVDLIVYFNRILKLPTLATSTYMDKIAASGIEGIPEEKYLDYGVDDTFGAANKFHAYDRSLKFPGCIEGYYIIDGVAVPFSGSIMDIVFGGVDYVETVSGIVGFAQSADDSRAVISFVHDNVVTAVDKVGDDCECTSTCPSPSP